MDGSCTACGAVMRRSTRHALPPRTLLRESAYRIDYIISRDALGITYAGHVPFGDAIVIREFFPLTNAYREDSTGAVRATPPLLQARLRYAVRRIAREGQALLRLDHPNITRVRDVFEERGTIFIITAPLLGSSLRAKLQTRPGGRLPSGEVAEVMEQIVESLVAVHRAGLNHLNLRPETILRSEDGRLVLTDFGAARLAWRNGDVVTPPSAYDAPELFSGPVGSEADVFSLGAILHELLTGKPPGLSFNRTALEPSLLLDIEEPFRMLLHQALTPRSEMRPWDVRNWWAGAEKPQYRPDQEDIEGCSDYVEFIVSPDGFSYSIADALAKAPAGATIQLRAGIHRMPAPCRLDKPITLIGEGAENTVLRIRYSKGFSHCGLSYSADGALTLRNVALVPEAFGTDLEQSALLEVEAGTALIEGCTFASGGVGIRVRNSEGVIRDCLFEDNSVGISISSSASFLIQSNTITGSRYSGIELWEEVSETPQASLKNAIRSNNCMDGAGAGIAVYSAGNHHLQRNRCFNNDIGIELLSDASATLDENECRTNEGNGIHISDRVQARIINNSCSRNGASGMGISGASISYISDNSFGMNQHDGISIAESAEVIIYQNNFFRNGGSGVHFADESGGVVRSNTCDSNANDGIEVKGGRRAQLKLFSNQCRRNQRCGISYWGEAGGCVKGNTLERNEQHGIDVEDKSGPLLESNACSKNGGHGIHYGGESAGVAQGNKCWANDESGIGVEGRARPNLQGNTCRSNEEAGIAFDQQSGGSANGNTCTGNGAAGIAALGQADSELVKNLCVANKGAGLEVGHDASPFLGENQSFENGLAGRTGATSDD
jgi:parallel beta-helix repeat protein